MSDSDQEANQREATVQIDQFGIRVKGAFQPNPADETVPSNWHDVLSRVNRQLMELMLQPLALCCDALKSTRSVVRGIGELPSSVAKRIREGHSKAEQLENNAVASPTRNHVGNLLRVLNQMEAKGIACSLEKTPDGRLLISVVRPEIRDESRRIGIESGVKSEST